MIFSARHPSEIRNTVSLYYYIGWTQAVHTITLFWSMDSQVWISSLASNIVPIVAVPIPGGSSQPDGTRRLGSGTCSQAAEDPVAEDPTLCTALLYLTPARQAAFTCSTCRILLECWQPSKLPPTCKVLQTCSESTAFASKIATLEPTITKRRCARSALVVPIPAAAFSKKSLYLHVLL